MPLLFVNLFTIRGHIQQLYVPLIVEFLNQFFLIKIMSGEKKQKPEDLLAKLRKIEDNKHCANCGDYAKLGHTNVCGILFTAYC